MSEFNHVTVLAEELIAALALAPGDIAIDCTAGGGGHTARMLAQVGSSGKVIAIDRDPYAIKQLQNKFARELQTGNLLLHQGVFSELASVVAELGLAGRVQGVAADLGVSSPQLDQGQRGFSWQNDGPLDMRMSADQGGITAEELIAESSQEELADIFYQLGEEKKSRYFARIIVAERERARFVSTKQLADFIGKRSPYPGQSRKHPATKIFQALRIKVNDELGEVSRWLNQAFAVLRPEGRLAVIAFHSLEDRLVKQFFLAKAGRIALASHLRDLPIQTLPGSEQQGKIIRPFPLVPSEAESKRNPRARSAKLRVIEKL